MKTQNPLKYYVDKLANGETFSLARFGDGELYCMWGKKGGNSNGCAYTPELCRALNESIWLHKNDPTFIYGLQRILPRDEERVMQSYGFINWHDTEIFSEAVANGELYPFLREISNHKLHFIGNKSIEPFLEREFPGHFFTEVPPSNAFNERERVLEAVRDTTKSEDVVVLFSCGMAANAFISELHRNVDGWLIDVGHIWDPFTGNMSRCDLEGKTLEDINKNLCPSEQ